MIKEKKDQVAVFTFLGIIWLYTFYASVIAPPFFAYYTVDENYIADSGVFLWFGMTPRCLDWPATPSLLIFSILFGIDCLISIFQNFATFNSFFEVFEAIDYRAYQYLTDRTEYLLVGRSVQLIIIGYFLILSVRSIYQKNHYLLTPPVQIILSVLIVTSYTVWFNAPVLRPEGISGSIFMFIALQLIFSENITINEARTLVVLFAVVVAERFLFLFISPIIFISIYLLLPQNNRWRIVLNLTGRFLIILLALCPFILTDPLVVAKSFIGGIIAKMNDKPMETLFNKGYIISYFENPASYLVLVSCLVGVYTLIRQRQMIYWVIIINWMLFLLMVLRSAKIYDTHVLPAATITIICTGLGLGYLARKSFKIGKYLASVIVILLVTSNLWNYVEYQNRTRQKQNLHEAFNWIQGLPQNSRLLVLPEMEFYIAKSEEVLQKEIEQNRDTTKMIRKLNYLLGNSPNRQMAKQNIPISTSAFAFEDERLYDLQYQLLLKYNRTENKRFYNFEVYLDNTELASHSVQWDKALQDFFNGEYTYLLTERTLEGLEPIIEFNEFAGIPLKVYKTSSAKK
ncbi:hypothetical protein [Telluribacter sp.]|jgi:hypothetical protein|uniref:hypothetical protein n=1 Tax=Telluribacter sp. TaxID=1978767 RepID=UPI002E110555|nr:hypothetical protein [Telluribacter sp.]